MPEDFSLAHYRLIDNTLNADGQGMRVIISGGIERAGIYYLRKGACLRDALSLVSYLPHAHRRHITIINHKQGFKAVIKMDEGDVALDRWLLNRDDLILISVQF